MKQIETFKINIIVFISYVIMCLTSHWPIVFSIRVSSVILKISLCEIKGKLSKLLIIYNWWLSMRWIQGFINPSNMIFTEASEVNIMFHELINPCIHRNWKSLTVLLYYIESNLNINTKQRRLCFPDTSVCPTSTIINLIVYWK
jgi:hypothetical protein